MCRTRRLLIVILLLGGLPLLAHAAPAGKTQQKLFSPTQAPPNAQYVGNQTCAQCHEEHARHQINSSMGQALQPCASCDVLRANPFLTWQSGSRPIRWKKPSGVQSLVVSARPNVLRATSRNMKCPARISLSLTISFASSNPACRIPIKLETLS